MGRKARSGCGPRWPCSSGFPWTGCLQFTRVNQGAANVDEDGGHLQGPAPGALDTVGPGLGLSHGSDHQVAPPICFCRLSPWWPSAAMAQDPWMGWGGVGS